MDGGGSFGQIRGIPVRHKAIGLARDYDWVVILKEYRASYSRLLHCGNRVSGLSVHPYHRGRWVGFGCLSCTTSAYFVPPLPLLIGILGHQCILFDRQPLSSKSMK